MTAGQVIDSLDEPPGSLLLFGHVVFARSGAGVVHVLSVYTEDKTACGQTLAIPREVNEFDDDSLCQGCYLTVAEESRDRLFEHPQGV